MKSYITHRQYVALLEVIGPIAADLLRDLGIIDAERLEQPHNQAVKEGMYDDLLVEIMVPDVLDPATGYPWLGVSEAEAVVRSLGDGVWTPYRYNQLEATPRKLDLTIEPPIGWFQWLNKQHAYIWTRWTKKDQAVASTLGWTVRNYPAAPTIQLTDHSTIAQAETDLMARLRGRAMLWCEGHRDNVTRVCSRAIALIDCHSARSDTSNHHHE